MWVSEWYEPRTLSLYFPFSCIFNLLLNIRTLTIVQLMFCNNNLRKYIPEGKGKSIWSSAMNRIVFPIRQSSITQVQSVSLFIIYFPGQAGCSLFHTSSILRWLRHACYPERHCLTWLSGYMKSATLYRRYREVK